MAGLSAAGRDVGDVIGVAVTHVHPDHHGLTARLVAAVEAAGGSAWMGMHADEAASLPSHFGDDGASDVDWLRRNGVPEDVATEIGFGADDIHEFLAIPDPTVEIADGELLALPGRTVHALATPGHTPGHLCFYDEDNELLLTGDHILPRISPNVGMQPHSARPPLGSLRRLRVYDDAEVLPAHEWRFRGVAARIDTLLHRHDERCDEILGLLATSRATAWQLAERLTWSRGWDRITGMQRRGGAVRDDRSPGLSRGAGRRVRADAGAWCATGAAGQLRDRRHGVDVAAFGVRGAHPGDLGPGVVLGAADRIGEAGPLPGDVTRRCLLVEGVQPQLDVVARSLLARPTAATALSNSSSRVIRQRY